MSTKVKLEWLKHKKSNHIYNKKSSLVIKSAQEKVVIGRIENDEFVELDKTCIELCEQYGLTYGDTKIIFKSKKNLMKLFIILQKNIIMVKM